MSAQHPVAAGMTVCLRLRPRMALDGRPPSELRAALHLRAAIDDFGQLAQTLQSGGLVVIYPEGELSPDGRIGPLKSGLASLARGILAGARRRAQQWGAADPVIRRLAVELEDAHSQ